MCPINYLIQTWMWLAESEAEYISNIVRSSIALMTHHISIGHVAEQE